MAVSLAKQSVKKTMEVILAQNELSEQNQKIITLKIDEAKQKGTLLEMVDWSTYVTPGTPGFIHGELLHPVVSGNGVDYTTEELVPAVNTLIKKPIYKVPNSYKGPSYTSSPDNLHKDPNKKIVGEVNLVRYKNGAINFLANVDDETYMESVAGHWGTGSIEANFVKMEESTKTGAAFSPEFINFTGYLLLPSWAEAGDPGTTNHVYESVMKKFNVECPSLMINREHKKTGVSLAFSKF